MSTSLTGIYRLPLDGRAQLRTCRLTRTDTELPDDMARAAADPSVYAIYGMAATNTGTNRRHPVGYTGVTTTTGQRMVTSLTKLYDDLPDLELRGIGLLSVTGLPEAMRDSWLHAIESEITADQCLRRAQVQRQSRAPGSIARLRAAGVSDQAMARAMRRILAGVRDQEQVIGIGNSPWGVRGSASLRDQIAVCALRLADADGRVGNFAWFLDRLAEVPAVHGRDIARLSDSAGRDVRNRETDLVLKRMHLDDDRVLYVTARALAAVA